MASSSTDSTVNAITGGALDGAGADGPAQGTVDGAANGDVEGSTDGTVDGASNESTDDLADSLADGAADNTANAASDGTADGTSDGLTGGTVDAGSGNGVADSTTDSVADGAPNSSVDGETHDAAGNAIDIASSDIVDGTVDGAVAHSTIDGAADGSSGTANGSSDGAADDAANGISDTVADGTADSTADVGTTDDPVGVAIGSAGNGPGFCPSNLFACGSRVLTVPDTAMMLDDSAVVPVLAQVIGSFASVDPLAVAVRLQEAQRRLLAAPLLREKRGMRRLVSVALDLSYAIETESMERAAEVAAIMASVSSDDIMSAMSSLLGGTGVEVNPVDGVSAGGADDANFSRISSFSWSSSWTWQNDSQHTNTSDYDYYGRRPIRAVSSSVDGIVRPMSVQLFLLVLIFISWHGDGCSFL